MKERIRELAHATEFLPFTILVADGREYHVPTRDHIFAPPHSSALIVVMDDKGGLTHLSALLISGVRVKSRKRKPRLELSPPCLPPTSPPTCQPPTAAATPPSPRKTPS